LRSVDGGGAAGCAADFAEAVVIFFGFLVVTASMIAGSKLNVQGLRV